MIGPKLVQVEQPVDTRITLPAETRALCGSLSGRFTRLSGFFGRNWTTRTNVETAREELLHIAEEALALRRKLG